MSEGYSELARVLQSRVKEITTKPDLLDFAKVGQDMSLLVDKFPVPVPPSGYSICRSLAHSFHTHDEDYVPLLEPIKAGDRVLVAWVGDEAVVIDVIDKANYVVNNLQPVNNIRCNEVLWGLVLEMDPLTIKCHTGEVLTGQQIKLTRNVKEKIISLPMVDGVQLPDIVVNEGLKMFDVVVLGKPYHDDKVFVDSVVDESLHEWYDNVVVPQKDNLSPRPFEEIYFDVNYSGGFDDGFKVDFLNAGIFEDNYKEIVVEYLVNEVKNVCFEWLDIDYKDFVTVQEFLKTPKTERIGLLKEMLSKIKDGDGDYYYQSFNNDDYGANNIELANAYGRFIKAFCRGGHNSD